MVHADLKKAVDRSLEELFNDTSVSQLTTKDELEDIIDRIENMIDTLIP